MTDIPNQLALVPESFQIFFEANAEKKHKNGHWGQNFICWPWSGVLPYRACHTTRT